MPSFHAPFGHLKMQLAWISKLSKMSGTAVMLTFSILYILCSVFTLLWPFSLVNSFLLTTGQLCTSPKFMYFVSMRKEVLSRNPQLLQNTKLKVRICPHQFYNSYILMDFKSPLLKKAFPVIHIEYIGTLWSHTHFMTVVSQS